MSQENCSNACEASRLMPLPVSCPFTTRNVAKEPCQVLNGRFHAIFLVHMPSPAASIPSRHW
eukprot:557427-Amphidinium_carterae.1